jgi:pyruvate-formate lyase-activating enzyme
MTHTLATHLDDRTTEGTLVQPLPDGAVRCVACGHRCLIRDGRRGICRVRFNQSGKLRVPWGYVAGVQCDPVEKKPFFHVLPGADALTFGMLGCDFHCGYCQNWVTSQALRDDKAGTDAFDVTPEALVARAEQQDARVVVSSYNEPLITAEWAAEVFGLARSRGFLTGFVSNGNATPEALDFIRPVSDCYKIDLKTMNDRHYRQLGGVLDHVLEAIGLVHERGIWLEVLTLIVPGFSDDPVEVRRRRRSKHSLARHRVSPGLPVLGHGEHDRGGPGPGLRDRGGGGAQFRLRGKPPGVCRTLGAHLVSRLSGAAGRTARLCDPQEPGGRRRTVPRLWHSDPGHLREPARIQRALT